MDNQSGVTAHQIVPLGVGLVVAGLLIYFLGQISSAAPKIWEGVALAGVVLTAGVVAMLATHRVFRHPAQSTLPSEHDPVRARLAPAIIAIGTLGIVGLASVVVILIYLASIPAENGTAPNPLLGKLDTILLGVFSATLPVFATWVGTVLAFYFTNESFRTASESVSGQAGPKVEDAPLNNSLRMIPFEKITFFELPLEAKPEAISLAKIQDTFGSGPAAATLTRLPLLDTDKRIKFLVRRKLLDSAVAALAAKGAAKESQTLAQYLDLDQNRADAANFRLLPLHATVGDGRRMMKLHNTVDIFLTNHGLESEPIKGWVTDDHLK